MKCQTLPLNGLLIGGDFALRENGYRIITTSPANVYREFIVFQHSPQGNFQLYSSNCGRVEIMFLLSKILGTARTFFSAL